MLLLPGAERLGGTQCGDDDLGGGDAQAPTGQCADQDGLRQRSGGDPGEDE